MKSIKIDGHGILCSKALTVFKKSALVLLVAAIFGSCSSRKTLRIVVERDHIPDAVIAKFEKESGIKVEREYIESEWGQLAELLNAMGRTDLFLFDNWAIEELVKEHRLEPFDPTAVPNLGNIAPEFRNLPMDPGNKHSIPYLAGILGIVVDASAVTRDISNFGEVFLPEFAKKSWVECSQNDLAQIAWASEHKAPFPPISSAKLDELRPLLAEWLNAAGGLGNRTPDDSFRSKNAVIGIVWSGQGARLLRDNPSFRWIVPEGTTYAFIDSFAMPAGCLNKSEAQQFVNFLLRPDIGKVIAQSVPYTSPNAAARALIPESEIAANPAAFPPFALFKRMDLYHESALEYLRIQDLFHSLDYEYEDINIPNK